MRRCRRLLSFTALALVVGMSVLAGGVSVASGGGVAGTLIGLSNEQIYEMFDQPKFIEAGEDGEVFNFNEWETYSAANPTEQGNDGIIEVKNKVIITYFIGYTPDYSKGRFDPGFLVFGYRAEADKYIRLEDLPAYCLDTIGIAGATSVYRRPTEVKSLGSQVTGSVISYVMEAEALTEAFGSIYSGKRVVVSVRVLDGESLGYPGEHLVDSYQVSIIGDEEIGDLGTRVD